MTGRAGENRVVRRISMAIAARLGAPVGCIPPRVVEGRSRPRRGGMAGRACRWKARRLMGRIRRVFVFSRMAGIAISRGACIGVVDVAQIALHTRMCAGQREGRRAVIEGRPRPGSRVMAG